MKREDCDGRFSIGNAKAEGNMTKLLVQDSVTVTQTVVCATSLTFRHRASSILGQAFHYSPENAFYILNQQIYFII